MLAKHDPKFLCPTNLEILMPPLRSALKFKGSKFTLTCSLVHKRREFEASM